MQKSTTVGLLYPGYSAEDDFPDLEKRLNGAVRLPLVHTSVGEDAHRVDALLDLGSTDRLAGGARQLLPEHPDAVLWACTSGSFVFGWDGAHGQVADLQQVVGVPTSSTSLAFARACQELRLSRVVVSASYPQDVAERFAEFLGHAGVEVLSMRSHGIITAAEVGTLGEQDVAALVRSSDRDDAEAILVPDTAMHSLAWIDALEEAAGKPVLTANQVSVWEGLRVVGAPRRYDGLGTLFRAGGDAA